MITTKTFKNTILVTFEKCTKLDSKKSVTLKREILNSLTKPFTNLLLDLKDIKDIDREGIEALLASQRFSEMNKSQISLFNVKDKVLSSLRTAQVDHFFFFCDRPKPFSEELMMA